MKENYSYKGQVNGKVKTNNKFSEFIINSKDGSFVTQWDVLKTVDGKNARIYQGKIDSNPDLEFYEEGSARKMIVETESFSYASEKDEHENLDMYPADKNNLYENDLKLKIKDNWKSENKDKYDERLKEPEDYEVSKKMKIYRCIGFSLILLFNLLILFGCSVPEDKPIAEIIDEENYIKIHKQAYPFRYIFIDDKGDKAYGWEDDIKIFSEKKIEFSAYRNGEKIVRLTQDGADITNGKESKYYIELSKETYFAAIKNLNLTAKNIKNSNYKYITKSKKEIDILLKQEIISHTIDFDDKIKYIELSFDNKFRPVKVRIVLESSKHVSTKEELKERGDSYTHWFSYDLNKNQFKKEFNEIKKMIYEEDKEYEEWLEEHGDSF
ncbi:MAG: hypothetical protein ABF289_09235 [Clostridiales bacterium]